MLDANHETYCCNCFFSDHPGLPADHVGVHGTAEPVATEELLWSLASGYLSFTQGHSSIVVAFLGNRSLDVENL